MIHRPRCRRASASPYLLAVLAPLVALMAFRAGPTWNGVRLGATEHEVVASLGQPESRDEIDSIVCLKYADMELWLRDDQAYGIALHGDPVRLRTHASLALGLPIGERDGTEHWQLGDTTAALWGDTLSIHGP